VLTKTQQVYLEGLDKKLADSRVFIPPYNPLTTIKARKIIKRLKKIIPNVRVDYCGSSALKIAGLPDVDLFIFEENSKRRKFYLGKISKFLKLKPKNEKFKWVEDGIKITLKLANPNEKKRIENNLFFQTLKKDLLLRKKFEEVKLSKNNKKYRDYVIAKMDFTIRLFNVVNPENMKRMDLLKKHGIATYDSHVKLRNNIHSRMSFSSQKLFRKIKIRDFVFRNISNDFVNKNVDVVVGISSGGDVPAQRIGSFLSKNKHKTIPVFLVKKTKKGDFKLNGTKDIFPIRNRRVLIVDDTSKAGKSLWAVYTYLKKLGAKIVGMTVVCARNNIIEVPRDVVFYPFVVQDDFLNSYHKKNCPMCKEKIPLSISFGYYRK
jgi:orotate phosphoribosyltransferase